MRVFGHACCFGRRRIEFEFEFEFEDEFEESHPRHGTERVRALGHTSRGGDSGLMVEHLDGLGFFREVAETGGGGVGVDDQEGAFEVSFLVEHEPAAGAGLGTADLVLPVAAFEAMQVGIGRGAHELNDLATEAFVVVDVDVAVGVLVAGGGVGLVVRAAQQSGAGEEQKGGEVRFHVGVVG